MFLRRDRIKKIRVPDVTVGADVYTADGELLGKVKEVGDVSFHVDARFQPDFWLGRDYVVESSPQRVAMSFNNRDLNAYKLGGQGQAPDEDPSQEPLADAAVSEEEQIDQRIRMEQELAQQRQRLPHEHPAGEEAPPDTGGTIGQPVEEELREYGVEPGATPSEPASPAGSVVGETLDQARADHPANGAAGAGAQEPRQRELHADEQERTFGVSIPTRERPAYDPGRGREQATIAGAAAVGGLALATVSGLLLLRQRRSRRRSRGERLREFAESSLERVRSA